jgi:hypothetical protein
MGALGSAPCRKLPCAPQLRPPCFVSAQSQRFRWGSSPDASGRRDLQPPPLMFPTPALPPHVRVDQACR